MRTNIVLDDELVNEGLRLTHLRTKKDLVNYALKELVTRKKRKSILELEGKLAWEGDLEDLRRGRLDTG